MSNPKSPVILVYSDDSTVRQSIVSSLGSKVSAEFPSHTIVEFATGAALHLYVDEKRPVDLFILDGEAVPEGGLGIARQFKDEVYNCPPVLVVTGRPSDAWLASWSLADGTVTHPIDPFTLAGKVAELLRPRILVSNA